MTGEPTLESSYAEVKSLNGGKTGFVESFLLLLKGKWIWRYLGGSFVLSTFYLVFISICEFIYSRIIGESFIFPFNIFFIRDILIAVIVPPIYLFLLEQLRRIPETVRYDIKLELEDQKAMFRKFYDQLFDRNKEIIMGLFCAIFYGTIIISYLIYGKYSLGFFVFRLVGIPGAFLAGAVLYEAIIIMIFFVRDVRKIKLNISSLFTGLRPITAIGSTALFLWNAIVVILSIPMLALGFNNISVTWYVGFYGSLYLAGLVMFLMIVFGFHLKMVELKKELLNPFVIQLNSMQCNKETTPSFLISSEEIALIEQIQVLNSAKEWPIDFAAIRDLIFTYTIPILLSIFGVTL